MKTNKEIYDINYSKIKKTFNKKKKSYNCIFHFLINRNDFINSIDINDDKVVFGTLMGDVYLCRVDEKKLNYKIFEVEVTTEKKEKIKSSNSSRNKTSNIDNDKSNFKLNNSNSNNKYDCIKLSINNNKNYDNKYDNDNNNVKIFNKKNNYGININYNNSNNNNSQIKNNNNDNNENENQNYTEEENIEEEDENSNKYEKKLINKNMGKVQSSPNIGNSIEINKPKTDSKIFNEKKEQNKSSTKSKNKYINFPQITKLIYRSKENIPCIEFENNDIINVSIGDLEVIRLENMSTFNINDDTSTYNYSKLRNYNTENDHLEFCENCTCMMKNSFFLIIYTKYANYNSNFEIKDIEYENKDLKKYKIIKGQITMSNYVVPFDFDGDKFLFLDYISKNERKISVVYTATKKENFNYYIKNKEYGHICHMKLLPHDKIFLCKKNNECEIHLMNKSFDEIYKWKHIGEDVITCYIYIKNINKNNNSEHSNQNNDNNDDYNDNYIDENNDIDESNESNDEQKSLDEIKKNLLKIFNRKKIINLKKGEINVKQTINLGKFNTNCDKENTINIKKKEQNIISSNGNENVINYTENNPISYNKKRFFNKKIHSMYSSSNNSSRRDINLTIENKNITKNRNSKDSYTPKDKVLSNDKRKKYIKNDFTTIEIYEKKEESNFKKKLNLLSHNKTNLDNDEEQTVVNNKENGKYSILTLDKNGTLNIYKDKKQKTLFNIYNLSNIDNKYKKMEFFSMGFPYYMVANEYYFGITTDHGLFVIAKINN